MRNTEEVRDLWRRLTNPETVEDWGLSIPLAELKQCPEIWAEVSAYLPSHVSGEIHEGSIIAKKLGEGIRKQREEILLKCLGRM